LSAIPGVVDAHVFQVPDAPALTINVDRTLGNQLGVSEDEVAKNVLVTANSSAQTVPNFWIDPRNSVSYPLVVQMPTYRVTSTQDLATVPISAAGTKSSQILMNVAQFGRKNVPLVVSQLNIRPVFDVNADVQGRDLASAAVEIDKVLDRERVDANKTSPVTITLSGHVLGPVPAQGVAVELLVHYRGRWEPFRVPQTDSRGRFEVVYQFQGGIGRFPFRASVLGGQAGFPFAHGESRAVDVTTN